MEDFFKWRESWMLDIEALDQQHQALAMLLNRIAHLYLASKNTANERMDVEKLAGLLDKLYADTRQHFIDEERLMVATKYQGHARHANEHVMLQAELKNCISNIKEGKEKLNIDMLSSLKSWFIVHITSSDKAFALYLQASNDYRSRKLPEEKHNEACSLR